MKIKYLLPEVYQPFFDESLWNFSLAEKKATCEACIQAPHKYKADLKCCTFWPFIPNYIIGSLLLSREEKYAVAQKVIRDLIQNHRFVLPLGVVAPPEYQRYFKKNKSKIFGQSESFLCPYYLKDKNHCGIWIFRGSVCASFYCESSYGKKGNLFWQAFENYLSYLEMALAEEVLVYSDYSPRELSSQLEYLDGNRETLTPTTYEKIWKHHLNKEEEFYINSAKFVNDLPKTQISDIKGELGISLALNLKEKLTGILKTKVKLNKVIKN